MKKLIFAALCFCGITTYSRTIIDVYDFTATVLIPRTYNNTENMGYRQNQSQKITGHMGIVYTDELDEYGYVQRPAIYFLDLTNQTHKINNKKIGYKCSINNDGYMFEGPITRVNFIGDNKKDLFKTPSVDFYLDAEPDYNVGEDDEDNSLLGTLSGGGTCNKITEYKYECANKLTSTSVTISRKKVKVRSYYHISSLNGKITGTLGCGCEAYGHKSPTRIAGLYGASTNVDDVAKIEGTWSATYNSKLSTRGYLPEDEGFCDWDVSTNENYPSKDGWIESNSDSNSTIYYNTKKGYEVRTPDMISALPSGYSWELSYHKTYSSINGFYHSNTNGMDFYCDVLGNMVIYKDKKQFTVLHDLYAKGEDPWFKECSDYSSLYLVKYSSSYYLIADG